MSKTIVNIFLETNKTKVMIKLEITGNLGQNAKLRETNGKAVLNFSIADNRKITKPSGEVIEKTTWVSCSYWANSASKLEKLSLYLKKGVRVFCSGYPSVNLYTTENGTKADLKLTVNELEIQQFIDDDKTDHQETEMEPNENFHETETNNNSSQDSDDLPF